MAKKEWKTFGTSLAQGAMSDASSGLVANLISLPFNAIYQHLALKNDKRRMETQAQLNREQYLLEHSQESPIAMRANLEDAELNPALMYSQGGLASGMNATVGPTSGANSAPQSAVAAKQTSLNNLLGLHRLESEIENIKADTEQKLSQAHYNRTLQQIADERAGLSLELLRGQVRNQTLVNLIKEIEAEFARGVSEQNYQLLEAKVADLRNQIANRDKATETEAKRVNKYIEEADAQMQKWKVENDYTRARIRTENETREANVNMIMATAKKYLTESLKNLSENELKEMDRRIREYINGLPLNVFSSPSGIASIVTAGSSIQLSPQLRKYIAFGIIDNSSVSYEEKQRLKQEVVEAFKDAFDPVH